MGTRPRRAWLCVMFTIAAAFVALTLAAAVLAPAVRAQPLSAAPGLLATAAIQQTEFLAPDGAAWDWFGFAVAVDGDTALVGAPNKTVGGVEHQGAVYVYMRSGGAWTLRTTLVGAEGADTDLFGFSVALDGDVALIGGRGVKSYQGAAWVFTRSGGVWTQQAKLTADDGVANDSFGWRVAVDGNTALISALEKSFGGNLDVGAAYVFTRSGDVWTQQDELIADDGHAWAFFGNSVALDGDTAVIGAYGATVDKRERQGAAYVFTRSGGSWSQQTKLLADDGAAGDSFGASVALVGDSALIGATGSRSYRGAAYVFARSGGGWTQQAELTLPDGAANDLFGISVALDGDTALVGAIGRVVGGNSAQGAAYLFARSGASWTQQAQLTAADGAANDQFGYAVALSGRAALVGDRDKKVGDNMAQGAAYLFGMPSTITPSVVGTPAHGSISPATADTYDYGSTPTFTFAPDSGYRVKVVKVDDVAVGTTGANEYRFPALTADHTISVEFADAFTITPSVVGTPAHGSISPATADTYDYGSTPTFTFAPDSGYKVDQVLVDGTAVTPTTATTYTFPAVKADHTISVSFAVAAGPPPVTTVSGRHKGWSRRPVKLTFTATPAPGGAPVAYTEYQVDGGAWTRGASLAVRTQGVVLIRYRSADTLGDVEQTRTCRVRIDSLRPQVVARHASGPAGGTVHLRYRVDDPVPGCGWALVRLVVTDVRGHVLTRASTRPAPTNDWRTVRISTGALGPGVYTVALRAMDAAGNFQRGVTRTTLMVR